MANAEEGGGGRGKKENEAENWTAHIHFDKEHLLA
jgi:hypothetical protein